MASADDELNPFQFGRVLGSDSLVDREDEVAEVVRTIREGGKLFLIGPRRFGKTSILNTAAEQLTQKSAVVVQLDAESYPTLDLLVSALVALAAKHLTGEVKKVGTAIGHFFSRLRPELEFNPAENTWSARLGADTSRHDHATLLVEALNGFERLAQAQPERRPVGLIIDEFQKLIELGGSSAEGQIRAAIQTHKRSGYVFAGSKTRILSAMVNDAARPFYRLGSVRFLGPVPRPDFHRFLTNRFIAGGFRLDSGAIEHLMNVAHDVPYNIQMLAHTCWTELRTQGTRRPLLSAAAIDQMLDRIVMRQDPFYTLLWNRLTAVQQKTLLALIRLDGRNLQSSKAIALVGKAPATIRKSVHLMIESGILREEETLNSMRVVFEDPFFERWITALIL